MSSQELKQLLERYAAKQATPEEEDRLVELFSDEQYKEVILEFLEKHWVADTGRQLFPGVLPDERASQLFSILAVSVHEGEQKKIGRVRFLRWAAAAAVLVAIAVGAYYYMDKMDGKATPSMALTLDKNDVAAPAGSLAELVIGGSSSMQLNTLDEKEINTDGVRMYRSNGKPVLHYSENATAGPEVLNELVNPRGSKQLILYLADKTKVMLNAGSKIKYPNFFAGSRRRVELVGEAYFEVAKDAGRPFEVHTPNGTIEVLGTHFNVMADGNDNEVQVTLLEGAVNVKRGQQIKPLLPGQKAIVTENIDVLTRADTAQAVAWTNDLFNFKGMELKEILEQVGEWYDISLEDQTNIPKMTLSGIISRDLPVSRIFELLSISSGLQFTITDKKIKIS